MVDLVPAVASALGVAVDDALATQLTMGVQAARERWPELPAPDDAFVAYLVDRARQQADLASALPRLRIDDLLLAWWASGGTSEAIAAFEATFASDLDALLRRFRSLDADELRQQLRVKLFIGSADTPPRIGVYTGFGFLQNWYRVVASRTFLDIARGNRRQRTDDLPDALLAQLADLRADPEAHAHQAEVLAALKRAFASALAELPRRDRTFLRHVVIDQLTTLQIAAMYGVHRVTVSRALSAAHAQIRQLARQTVLAELAISEQQLASAIRVLDSQLELSLGRLFAELTAV
ncbi:MAG TPA: sigma-70 family RNA polymerase sigma factor [Kofleriaceae bacterium]|jgi:RNA polymerase sigma-70 factor (ECF subfamily)|nr:sigma-70 family RNA polymerase sigma factor [Kofleriaceae bacterium]